MNTSTTMSPFTTLALKLIGVILILSSILDYITLAIPFEPLDAQWQISFTGQIVDRGIVPLVGIAFMLVGYWIEASLSSPGKKLSFDLRLPVFILASLMGLIFLLLVPLHLNNLRQAQTDVISQINQNAGEAENRIRTQFEQLNNLSQDPQRLEELNNRIREIDTAINSGQVQGQRLNPEQLQNLNQTKQQLENFRQLAQNPEALEARLNELQTQLGDRKRERENRAKTEAFKQGIRTGLSSLMLAVGYIAIGWLGLKNMGKPPVSNKKAAVR
ncbi:MAG: HpsJ family protein [Xenococcaceae cyanobacterium]